MAALPPVAFPFVEVQVKPPPPPVAQRSPGVIAVVGRTPNGAPGGSAAVNRPMEVVTLDDAATLFAQRNPAGVVTETPLFTSLKLAMLQDPKPAKIYGVRVGGNDYAAALAALEAADDVTFVALANEIDVGAAAAGGNAATNLMALKDHVETMSSQGQKRIGVAMIDPARAKSATYAADAAAAVANLKSSVGRMILVAARGATQDVATAAMAAIAGHPPHVSMVLKSINGVTIPLKSQYSPSEIIALGNAAINPIIDPALITGESLHFAEGRTFTGNSSLLFIDTVRVLDDIDFRLKAGLIGVAGDARITKQGLTRLALRIEGILAPLKERAVIVDYDILIPVLNVLNVPESAWTPADRANVLTARENRQVDAFVTVTYGPAIHHLRVTLEMKL